MIEELQQVLHSEIPLTKTIGIKVIDHTDLSLTLSAPLENNINHKCTAFGGSIYSVAVLSGWGLIYLLLKQHGLSGHIVIQESNTKFIKPVTSDITAKCSFESKEQYERFLKMYQRKGIARIQLKSSITNDTGTNVIFKGSYVVHT
ncbi:MAG: thioesterase domain-containing protein [Gammaproteobacteria bacterium]